jgi:subfamily B ATP-binding cassette protein MsbA
VSGEKRRDFHRWFTAAMAVTTASLVWVHYNNREKAMEKARNEVRAAHSAAVARIATRVVLLRGQLQAWKPDDPNYPAHVPFSWERPSASQGPPRSDFDLILTGQGRPDPVMHEIPGRAGKDGHERFWVHTTSEETSQALEGKDVPLTGGGEYRQALDFAGEGTASLRITASLVDPPLAGEEPVEVEALLLRSPLPPEPLGSPIKVEAADRAATGDFTFKVDADFRRARHDLVLRVPPGASPVKVTWRASIGDSKGPQLVIGVLKNLPERREMRRDTEEGRLKEFFLPAETVFLRGYIPLDRVTEALRTDFDVATEAFGERLYLTDASGTVVDAVPGYPEKIRRRVAGGERRSLASPATQRIKLGNAGSEIYEGFARDQVVGVFTPFPYLNGGLIVEREEKRVLAAFRGLQAWHFSAILFGILLIVPLVPPLVRKVREDTELPRLLAHAKPFVPYIAAIVLAAGAVAVGAGIFSYQCKNVTDEVLVSAEGGAYERLTSICWILVWVAAGMFAANWVKEYLGKYIQNHLIVEIRCALCEKIAHLPMSFHSKQRAGDLLSRIQNDVEQTNRGLEMLFGDVISDPVLILGCIATAFVINWRLALVVFVGMPLILIPISYFGRSIKKYARRRQAKKADVTHTIAQMLSGIRVVKAFRMEDHEAKRIRAVSGNYLVEAMKVARAQVTGRELLDFFNNLSTVIVTGVGGYLVLERQVSLGDIAAFGLVIGKMYRSSKNLTGNYNKMQESLAGTERIFEIMDQPDSMAERTGTRALVRPSREIVFDDVSFRYADDGPWVLQHLSFRVPVGTSVALVGATGAGKSTILDLAARFYDPVEGRILVDGIDLRDYSRDSLLSQVAIVTQEPFLFNASIAENLGYGRPGASPGEVESAARAAFIHDEIQRQPDGYGTVVGERGTRLSGGQRQRVTIARAILKDPPILLLDEATSALDSASEQKVQGALNGLMKDRTTFVIAHRLSTIQGVDKILVLEGGTIVEQGTHEELLRVPGGHYRRLYEIQFAAALRQAESTGTGPGKAAAAG